MNEMTEPVSPTTKTFFHAVSLPLAPGSVIEPGNWGRMLKNYMAKQDDGTLLRKTLFEQVRCQDFPDRPSRLNGIFLGETAKGLFNFLYECGRIHDIAYEVTLEQENARPFRTCYGLPTPDRPLLDALNKQARRYWQGENEDSLETRIEMLTTSPVRMVRRIGSVPVHYS